MGFWYIEYAITGEGTVCVEADSADAARALVEAGQVPVPVVWDPAEVEISAVSYVRMHKADAVCGATAAENAAGMDEAALMDHYSALKQHAQAAAFIARCKDGEPKGSIVIDTLRDTLA